MMKNILIVILLGLSVSAYSQISWFTDYEMAKNEALANNKLILMDFWATWCGPCVTMDKEMWSTTAIDSVSPNFVALKIDVDYNRDLAVQYAATSIPKVVIVDPAGNIVWQKVGYSTPSPYLSVLKNIPKSLLPADAITKEINKNGDTNSWLEIGSAYQKMGRMSESTTVQNKLFGLSDQYFKKAEKSANEEAIALYAELNQILNDAYRGHTKQALKKISKIDGDNSELENYIQAYCYKCTGDVAEMEKYKKRITNPELLAQLQ